MNTSRNRTIREPATELQDLDALVLAEIESLTRRTRPLRPRQATASEPERQVGTKPDNRGGPMPVSELARIHGEEREGDALSGEEAEGLFDEHGEFGDLSEFGDFSDMEKDEQVAVGGLYTPEEEAFITRAVGFLSQRDNADMILNRIWEQLTEANPEGFFRPEDPESTLSGTNAKQAPSRENSEGDAGA